MKFDADGHRFLLAEGFVGAVDDLVQGQQIRFDSTQGGEVAAQSRRRGEVGEGSTAAMSVVDQSSSWSIRTSSCSTRPLFIDYLVAHGDVKAGMRMPPPKARPASSSPSLAE
ncbi:hypothetical protein ACWZHB_16990 [Nocardia sp. FBN12]|uniref:hypothetical protein n=1 Tax=Nocardia sp. FBN12 TaxID=3419766 RepID=UPI003D052107